MKPLLKQVARRFGLAENERQLPGEKPSTYYDECYIRSEEYRKPYVESRYYFMWTVIVDRIIQSGCRRVLEIGCGPGQLASYLVDEGIQDYRGIDFSPAAIELAASKALPRAKFDVADALTTDIYNQYDYDVLICTEVLEHVEADLEIVARFAPGKRTLCTVPNFPYASHVRHFEDDAEVAERYGEFFDEFSVRTFRRPDSPKGKYFLFDGIARRP